MINQYLIGLNYNSNGWLRFKCDTDDWIRTYCNTKDWPLPNDAQLWY